MASPVVVVVVVGFSLSEHAFDNLEKIFTAGLFSVRSLTSSSGWWRLVIPNARLFILFYFYLFHLILRKLFYNPPHGVVRASFIIIIQVNIEIIARAPLEITLSFLGKSFSSVQKNVIRNSISIN